MPGILRTLSLWFLSGKSKKITREPLMKGYNDAKRVAILFEINSPDEIIKAGEIENNLIGQSKEIFKVFYIARKKFTGLIENSENTLVLTKKRLNLIQIPANHILMKLQSQHFDYMIDLSLSDCIPLIATAVLSGAKMITGRRSKIKEQYYDFMIDFQGNDDSEFHHYMLLYLKTINPHHNE